MLKEAHRRGLRTFGMLCPLLPGIADDYGSVSELVDACLAFGAEEIFIAPVNPRASGLRLTQEELLQDGFVREAESVEKIRSWQAWSDYCARLIGTVQQVMAEKRVLEKLRFLLYPGRLKDSDLQRIRTNDAGVKWLGN